MTVEITRASTFAIKEETTVGELIAPAAGSDYIPLRAGGTITPSIAPLVSDEFINNLGNTKPAAGLESVEGEHPAYVKHSGVEGQAPEPVLLYKSALGASETAGAEFNTVAASTTTVIKVDSGEGVNYSVGECLLIKDVTNGYSLRNIVSIAGDDLSVNFAVAVAPGVGVELGKAILVKPATSGHPSFSAWRESGSGGALEAVAGCRTSTLAYTLNAAGIAEIAFSYSGIKHYFNPIEIDATNNLIDFTDGVGTVQATLTSKFYRSPIELANEVATQMTAASLPSDSDTITCVYNSHGTDAGKFTITSDGTVLSILWLTGAGNATGAYAALGFDKTDDTGALTYDSDSVITHVIPGGLTAAYDDVDTIVIKNAELMVGSATDNICRKASTLTFTITPTLVDATSMCAETGLEEKVPSVRTVTMAATIILEKHESGMYDKFINNTSTQIMVNIGPKDTSGNWTPGEAHNIFFGNAVIDGHSIVGDDFVQVDLTATAFVTSSKDDIYLNWL